MGYAYVEIRVSPWELGILMGLLSRRLDEEDTRGRRILNPLWDRLMAKAAVFYEDPAASKEDA